LKVVSEFLHIGVFGVSSATEVCGFLCIPQGRGRVRGFIRKGNFSVTIPLTPLHVLAFVASSGHLYLSSPLTPPSGPLRPLWSYLSSVLRRNKSNCFLSSLASSFLLGWAHMEMARIFLSFPDTFLAPIPNMCLFFWSPSWLFLDHEMVLVEVNQIGATDRCTRYH
jgi:hypothetical protein